ncbi:MAG: cupin domain-containing protein [Clostridia bacterium]|nr:cupin domain-containing protein [Clostridia bacterium]
MTKLNVAAKIKDLRQFCDYTTAEIAQKIGIPETEYLEYEEGGKDVPIGTLYNIAAALAIDPTVLLTGKASTRLDCDVVYDGKGVEIERYNGYKFTSLANKFIGRVMEPMLVELDPEVVPDPVTHSGQEFNYVLSGELRVVFGEKEYYLREGDSIYFNPLIPHSQIAMGGKKAKFLTIILES